MANVTQKIQTFLGGVSRKADFDKLQGQVVEANNCYPDETYGMIKRPGTELLGTLGIDFATANDLYFFPIIREGQSRYLCGVGNGTIRMWSLDDPSVAITVNTPGGTSYLNHVSTNGILVNDAYRATSDDRRTIIVNRTKVCAEDTTLWSTGVDIDGPDANGNSTIDPFTWTNRNKNRNANSIDDLPDGRCVRVIVTNGGTGSSTRPLREGVHYLPVTVDDADANGDPIITEGSGLVIKCQVNASGYIDSANLAGCEVWAAGSGYPDQCPASIDGIPGSRVTIATGLRPAMVYRVVNSNADNDDMYFQAFSNETTADDYPGYVPGPRDRVDGPYIWKECPSPDSYVGIDPSTLPHQLRQINSTTFIFEPVDYSYRWAGDNTNNPAPSFIGSTINNAFFMNNRLGFLSEDNVILSRPINYGPSYATPQDYVPSDNPWVMRNYTEIDFFRQSAIGLNDADPIDIKAANNNTSIFHTAISTPQGTILFADGQQSLLFQPQGLLSPLTASINSLSNYDMTGDVNAVIVGEKYYFVNKSAKFCRIYSMINQGMQNPPVIDDVTKEVADWLPNDMTDLVACPTDNMIFVFNRTRNDVYARREIGEGSSWVKWSHSHPVVSLVVDHDLIFFMTSSGDDIHVSLARLYLLPDDYTLGESRTVYPTSEFTSIPQNYNYYNSIVGDTVMAGNYSGVIEYYKPWHSYYGDLNVDNTLDDTFDKWLPWQDTTPVSALISVSADETAASEEYPWNVGFKLTVRSTAGSTVYSPSSGSYFLPYDTKFRLRNVSGPPNDSAYDSTVVRCDTAPIHTGSTPPPYDKVRYVGFFKTTGNVFSQMNEAFGSGSVETVVTPWIETDPSYPLVSSPYQGDPYLYVGGNWSRFGGAVYTYEIVDHYFDPAEPNYSSYGSHIVEFTPWTNYSTGAASGITGNTEFGSYATDGKISIPWRSRSRIVTNDESHYLETLFGDLGGYGFLNVGAYAAGYSANPPNYFNCVHYGLANQETFSEVDGYWEFEKDGVITRWAGYDFDGTLRTTLPIEAPCNDPAPAGCTRVDPANPSAIRWEYVKDTTYTTIGSGNSVTSSAIQILDVYLGSRYFIGAGTSPYWVVKYLDANGVEQEGWGPRNELINGIQEAPRDTFTVFFSGGTCIEQNFGNSIDYSSNPDECCNYIWIQNTDGTEYNTGIQAKSFELIPDGDDVIVKYVPCSVSNFDPLQYSWVRYVGKLTNTEDPVYGGQYGYNIGSYLSDDGSITTDWKILGTNQTYPKTAYFVGSAYVRENSFPYYYYSAETYLGSSPFTDSAGTLTYPPTNEAWRANVTVTNTGNDSTSSTIFVGDIGAYNGSLIAYSPNPDSGGAFGMPLFRGALSRDTGGNLYTVQIQGKWEFTNDTSEGTQVTWGGINNGITSTDFEFTRRYSSSTFKTAYLRVLPTDCCGCPAEPSPPIILNTLSLDPNMDLYTTNVTVSGTTVTPPASFPKLTSQKMSYVIANLPGSTAVASDRAGDTGTLTWNADHTLTADTDLSSYATSLIIGYRFDYHLVLPTFYYNQGNSDFDYTASLTVSRVKFALGLSGQADFEINVRNGPGWESSYSQIISNEYLASTAPLSKPAIVSVPIHKRNSDFQLQVKSDSPFPLSVDSCMWEGNYSPRYYRRT